MPENRLSLYKCTKGECKEEIERNYKKTRNDGGKEDAQRRGALREEIK